MAKRWWTADPHYNNPNISLYCHRAWVKPCHLTPQGQWVSQEAALEVAEANTRILVNNHNNRVKKEDTTICVGDVACKGNEKGVAGLKMKPVEIISQLNGNYVIIEGNHDGNNGVKTVAEFMTVSLGHYHAGVQHIPLLDENLYKEYMSLSPEAKEKSGYKNNMSPSMREFCFRHAKYCRENLDFIICGHVHNKWRVKKIAGIWHINVGVDVCRYMPIDDQEVLEIYEKTIREQGK